MTAKQFMKVVEPAARLDYYESLRGSGDPCWFIRRGFQGDKLSAICSSPRLAWASAFRTAFPNGRLSSIAIRRKKVQR